MALGGPNIYPGIIGECRDPGAHFPKDVVLLQLVRDVPGPGVAGQTGVVADVAVFPDGTSILHWRTAPGTTEIYPSLSSLSMVRESSGRSRLVNS